MNECAVRLIECEIVKKEKKLAEIDLLLGPKVSQDYSDLLGQVDNRLTQRRAGEISEKDFIGFMSELAEVEKKYFHLMSPKVMGKNTDKKYALMEDIRCLKYSLGRLL